MDEVIYEKTKCRCCLTVQDRGLIEIRVTARSERGIYKDREGAFWNGMQCPGCFIDAKTAAEYKKRNKKQPVYVPRTPKQHNKQCEQCGNDYIAPIRSQKFCTPRCAKTYRSHKHFPRVLKDRVLGCVECGTEFIPKSAKAKYCSKKCKRIGLNAYHRARYAAIPKPKRVPKPKKIKYICYEYPCEGKCSMCDRIIVLHSKKTRHCSANCRMKERRREGKCKRNKTPAYRAAKKRHKKNHEMNISRRMPKWINKKAIAQFYADCPPAHYVDHIIPINGLSVSGLHVPWNFQYLPLRENSFKSNQFDGTYENDSWVEEFKRRFG